MFIFNTRRENDCFYIGFVLDLISDKEIVQRFYFSFKTLFLSYKSEIILNYSFLFNQIMILFAVDQLDEFYQTWPLKLKFVLKAKNRIDPTDLSYLNANLECYYYRKVFLAENFVFWTENSGQIYSFY